MSRLTRYGTAEPVSRDQILRQAWTGTGKCPFFLFSWLTTSRICNLTRLSHTLLLLCDDHTQYQIGWKRETNIKQVFRRIYPRYYTVDPMLLPLGNPMISQDFLSLSRGVQRLGRAGIRPFRLRGGNQNSPFRGYEYMIPYMVGKLAPNSSHLTRGLVKYVPGRGFFRAVSYQNGDKFVTSPPSPIVELISPMFPR